MDSPSVVLRFKNPPNVNTINEHNVLLSKMGSVFWGLWTKEFEDDKAIALSLSKIDWPSAIYFVDTTSKASPVFYVARVGGIETPSTIDASHVPEYYRGNISQIPFFFKLISMLTKIDIDPKIRELIGVPTIYFMNRDGTEVKLRDQQRIFNFQIEKDKSKILYLTDVHFGNDYGFDYSFSEVQRGKPSSLRTLPEVLLEDLKSLGFIDQVGAVVISGDIITHGKWYDQHNVAGVEHTGISLAVGELKKLSDVLNVSPTRFFVVPGNHDILREGLTPAKIKELLINYQHESGFRALREDFCEVYKLAPLNIGVELKIGTIVCRLGLLNSAYLNDKTDFHEYGYVGDEAEKVFEFMESPSDAGCFKILVVHHHLVPIGELEIIGGKGTVSVTLDAAYILRRSQESGIQLLLHGHQHFGKSILYSSWAPVMPREFRGHPRSIEIMACGSAGAKQDRLPIGESNMYGLIDLADEKPALISRRIYSSGRLGENW